jgi:hypothetical protein
MNQLSPVEIRSHLIPFLFKEFEGKEANYMGTQVSSIRFTPSSSISKYLYTQIDYQKKRERQDQFLLYLTVEKKKRLQYKGVVYIDQQGVKSALLMLPERIKAFNDLIEDIFRISFIYYIDASLDNKGSLKESIDKFIDKYDLLEFGFDNESLRRLYYRQKKTKKLTRLQYQSSNQVHNYC